MARSGNGERGLITVAEAEAAERAIIAEIGALGEAELAAVKAWIAGGCEGPQPRPDAEARGVLADRLKEAMAAREAAERATGGLGGAQAQVPAIVVEIAAVGRP